MFIARNVPGFGDPMDIPIDIFNAILTRLPSVMGRDSAEDRMRRVLDG